MTEAAWLNCTDPEAMLSHLGHKARGRKLRLFGAACCRRIWPLLADERSRAGVEVAERYADGEAGGEELTAAGAAACAASSHSLGRPAAAAEAAAEATWGDDDSFGGPYHASLLIYNAFYAAGEAALERLVQCRLLRDLFGNPFRPVVLHPSWRTPTVAGLAAVAYEQRALPSGELDRARLAVLADALEEAGCTDADLLGHLRGPGPHVRGCWALDLLRKE